jgi:hypothetical protein
MYVLYVMTCSTSCCLETAYGSMECMKVNVIANDTDYKPWRGALGCVLYVS